MFNNGNIYNNPYLFQPQEQIVTVSGTESIRHMNMAANSSKIVIHESQPIAYIIKTDGAGGKTIGVYDLVEHKEPTPENLFGDRIKKLEDFVYGHFKTDTTEDTTATE